MEFPDLGENCFVGTCNKLDFLPMKCDSCFHIFCKDHILYSNHSCINAYKKDIQVPVCPLCNQPIPSKRGEPPDIAVGQHIDADCSSDTAISKRKVYTNKCSLKGCKQKELIPVMCNSCQRNYCLKHRHPVDHKCQEVASSGKPMSQAGAAALARIQNSSSNQSSIKNFFNIGSRPSHAPRINPPINSFQGNMTEDEALACAIQASMVDNSQSTCNAEHPRSAQEEEDRLLAEALAASLRDAERYRREPNKDKSCHIS